VLGVNGACLRIFLTETRRHGDQGRPHATRGERESEREKEKEKQAQPDGRVGVCWTGPIRIIRS